MNCRIIDFVFEDSDTPGIPGPIKVIRPGIHIIFDETFWIFKEYIHYDTQGNRARQTFPAEEFKAKLWDIISSAQGSLKTSETVLKVQERINELLRHFEALGDIYDDDYPCDRNTMRRIIGDNEYHLYP
jgi:hypothetical protein